MKKKILLLIILVLLMSGCFKKDSMEGINIITTSYPITYLVNNIYGYNSTINSIYPVGIDIKDYKLTNKKLEEYSKMDMFVYNGLSSEKNIAASLLEKNKNIKIIDTTKGLNYKSRIEELWISPSNYLMLAQNIKNELSNYVNTTIVKQDIEANYDKTKLIISKFDADLKLIAENSENKTIIIADEALNFLGKYGFDVISIYKDGDIVQKKYQEAKNRISNKDNSYIYVLEGYDKKNEDIKSLVNKGASVLEVRTMSNLTEDEQDNDIDYEKFMTQFIEQIKMETYQS